MPRVCSRDGDLTVASDGYLYGTTSGRIIFDGSTCYGPPNCGAVFRMSTTGEMTLLHLFSGEDGAYPNGGLIQASDGNLYGVTRVGPNGGTLFRMTLPAGTVTTIASVNGYPLGDPAEGADGNFYLAAQETSGVSVCGGIFRVTKAGEVTKMHQFGTADNLCAITAGLIRGMDGSLYGAAGGGVFKMTAAGAVSVLHALTNAPPKLLIQGSDGALYGLRPRDDETQQGSVFRLDASGAFTTLHRFNWLDGAILSGINLDPPDALMVL